MTVPDVQARKTRPGTLFTACTSAMREVFYLFLFLRYFSSKMSVNIPPLYATLFLTLKASSGVFVEKSFKRFQRLHGLHFEKESSSFA